MAAASALKALPVEYDEPFLYHDIRRPGFAPILLPGPDGRKRQQAVWLRELPSILRPLEGASDVWISQCEFFKKNRRAVNLWHIPLAFADLDVYKVEGRGTLTPEVHTQMLLQFCDDANIPPPSLVVFSGRGLQVKWLFTAPLPRSALPRWQAVQRMLNNLLASFGADAQALDASRVLRLVGTRHSGSGELVRLTHMARTPTFGGELLDTGVVGYDFDRFADDLLPLTREELEARRRARGERGLDVERETTIRKARKSRFQLVQGGASEESAPSKQLWLPSDLAWARLEDLRTLVRLRGFEEGLPPGQRNLFVFLGACFLAQAQVVSELWPEVVDLAREFAPTWSNAELLSCISSVKHRAQLAQRGETITFGDIQVPPTYRWKNETLAERLSVTPAEERQMLTIMSKAEAQRRNTEQHAAARRAKGALTRETYIERAVKQKQEARALRAAGWNLKPIAEKLGVSVSTVSGYCKS